MRIPNSRAYHTRKGCATPRGLSASATTYTIVQSYPPGAPEPSIGAGAPRGTAFHIHDLPHQPVTSKFD
jgi:hypothetical protein